MEWANPLYPLEVEGKHSHKDKLTNNYKPYVSFKYWQTTATTKLPLKPKNKDHQPTKSKLKTHWQCMKQKPEEKLLKNPHQESWKETPT